MQTGNLTITLHSLLFLFPIIIGSIFVTFTLMLLEFPWLDKVVVASRLL